MQWKHSHYTTETERGSLLEDGANGRCQIKLSHMLQGNLCYDMRPSCIFKCFNKEVLWPFQANPAFGLHRWHKTMKTTFLQLCWASVRFCTHIKQTAPDYFPAACLLWLIKCLVILFQSVSDWLVLSYISCSVCTSENLCVIWDCPPHADCFCLLRDVSTKQPYHFMGAPTEKT